MAFTIPNQAAAWDPIQAQIDSIDLVTLASSKGGNGVVRGFAVSQRGAGANMSVDISHGLAFKDGYYLAGPNLAGVVENVTITAADTVDPRIDVVCITAGGLGVVVAGTPASVPSAPAITSTYTVLAMVLVPANATSITNSNIIDKRIVVPDYWDVYTEFLSGSTESGETAKPLAVFNTVATSGSIAHQAGETGHPGLIRATSGAVSGNFQELQLWPGSLGVLNSENFTRVTTIVRWNAVTNSGCEFDMVDASSGTNDQISCFSYNGANFTARVSNNNVDSSVDTGIAPTAGRWLKIEYVRDSTGWIACVINDAVRAWFEPGVDNIPSNDKDLYVSMLVNTQEAVAKTADWDFLGIKFAPTQRYT